MEYLSIKFIWSSNSYFLEDELDTTFSSQLDDSHNEIEIVLSSNLIVIKESHSH